jgi:UDP-N-acetylglucosamine/UDP-N-acetylgalactosamine diphosphorylase
MIEYPGYDGLIQDVFTYNQEHVFEYWDDLNDGEKKSLLDDLLDVDFTLLKKLYSYEESVVDLHFGPAPYIHLPVTEDEMKKHARAADTGKTHIQEGKAAAFVVAGGQGSRLGYDGPKGKFGIGPVSGKTLFQIHAEKILKYSQKYRVEIPFLIMTSRANHDEISAYFKESNYFGLAPGNVYIFPQNMVPSLDSEGRIILETRKSIFKNPDGHGGSLTALHTSGVLDLMKKKGIETISYFQVDNPLVKIIDPVFIGFHVMEGAEISSKIVKKAGPEEKVGVFVRFSNNATGVVEYSDFPEDRLFEKGDDKELKYSASNTAIHLFDRRFVERITAGKAMSLPFHVARKKIKALKGGTVKEIDGFKFEKFVFDAFPLAGKTIVLEVLRENEFAPVKSATGADSVESARMLICDQYRRWLAARGIQIPRKAKCIEISPLLAVEPDDIDPELVIPDEEKVYLS